MKQLNRNFRLATMIALSLMMSATEGSTGGTANVKSADQIAEEAAQAAAAKQAAATAAKEAKQKAAADAKAAKQKAAADAKAAKLAAATEAAAKKEAEKAAATEAKRLAAEEKAKQRAASVETKIKVVMPSQHGITRPKDGTKTGDVWALADKLSAEKRGPVAIAELMPEANKVGLNDATVRTQYARWKQFNGVFGPVAKAKIEAPAPAAGTDTGSVDSTAPEQAAA